MCDYACVCGPFTQTKKGLPLMPFPNNLAYTPACHAVLLATDLYCTATHICAFLLDAEFVRKQ